MKRKQDDFDREIESHIALETDRLVASGLTREEAETQARKAFGSVAQTQERFYDSAHWQWWDRLQRNVRYALRQMRRNPGFAAVVVATIGLGVGLNSAVFSAIDSVLLRPLPFPEGGQLVRVHQRRLRVPLATFAAPARLKDWDAMNSTFQALTGY